MANLKMKNKIGKWIWYWRYRAALQNKIWFYGLKSCRTTLGSIPESDKEWMDIYRDLYKVLVTNNKGMPIKDLEL